MTKISPEAKCGKYGFWAKADKGDNVYPIIIRQAHKAKKCIHCENQTHNFTQQDWPVCDDCMDSLTGKNSHNNHRYADVTDKYNYLKSLCKQNSLILQISISNPFSSNLIIWTEKTPLTVKLELPSRILFLDNATLDEIVSIVVKLANVTKETI